MKEKRIFKIFIFSLLMLPALLYAEKDNEKESLFENAAQIIKSEEDSPIKKLLGRSMIKDGNQYLFVEMYFPDSYGIIQGSGFYSPSEDTGEWVEDLLIKIEEERIAEELREMEKELEDYNEVLTEEPPQENQEEENVDEKDAEEGEPKEEEEKKPSTPAADAIENFFLQNNEGKSYTGKDSQLEFYQFDNEVLMRQKSNGKTAVINSSSNRLIRNFYDERMRLSSREKWNISNVQKAFVEKKESFNYDGDTNRVLSKEIRENDKLEIIKYNDKNTVESVNTYIWYEEKKYLTFKRQCSYNDEGKILSDETSEYIYLPDYKKLSEEISKKYVYEYNAEGIPPDLQYSENGILKLRNKYSDQKGTYTSQVFFDDGFSVKTYYENNARVKEVYYTGNKVMREKIYEY